MTPLELTRSELKAHWGHLGQALRELPMPRANNFTLKPFWTTDLAAATLLGPLAEMIDRERGGRVRATPLFEAAAGSTYWVSWREKWNFIGGSRDRWRFRESGVTVFQGESGASERLQLFRVEWPGFTSWRAGAFGWQTPGAGYPHWQFDAVVEIERRAARAREIDQIVKSLRTESDIQEFGVEPIQPVVTIPPDRTWTRMHFAAHARWSEIGWDGDPTRTDVHAHAPTSAAQIRRWLTASILYIRNELKRHKKRGQAAI